MIYNILVIVKDINTIFGEFIVRVITLIFRIAATFTAIFAQVWIC